MNQTGKIIIILSCILLLSACLTTSRYSQRHDSAPVRPPTQIELKDAQVQIEPINGSTKPYKINGIQYTPMKKRKAMTEVGIASWYGKKFHGHLTSNGEIYDMYGMTAAHKTLPLPSYVRVTNLKNKKSVVVRVNDRGPFHQKRIIDLSYSAAYKIGVYDTGTAKVKMEVLLAPEVEQQFQVQVSGFNSKKQAEELGRGLSILLDNPVTAVAKNNINSLLFGPFDSKSAAQELLNRLIQFGYPEAKITTSN